MVFSSGTLEALKGFGLSITMFAGVGLYIGFFLSYGFTIWTKRLRTMDYILAAVINLPVVIYLAYALVSPQSRIDAPLPFLSVLYIMLGGSGFSLGWLLGLFWCVLVWRKRAKDLANKLDKSEA